MFAGQLGKDMMIRQGYVPPTCTLPVEFAGLLIWESVNKGVDACAGCNADRGVCKGRPHVDDDREEIHPGDHHVFRTPGQGGPG